MVAILRITFRNAFYSEKKSVFILFHNSMNFIYKVTVANGSVQVQVMALVLIKLM